MIAQNRCIPGTSRLPRNARTVLLQMALTDARRKEEISARIKELRGPKTQQAIADAVGVTLRAYQAWEAGGGISYDNLVALATALGVSDDYLLYGERGPNAASTHLERIEAKLDAVLDRLGIVAEAVGVTLPELEWLADLVAEAEAPAGDRAADTSPVRRAAG